MKVNYSTGKPPHNLYNRCREAFGKGVNWDNGIIFTYGDTVYCKMPLSEDLKVHEETHVKQQALLGADYWWGKYFEDSDFRFNQEIEAYKNQLAYIRKTYNRNLRKQLEKHIYWSLANIYDFNLTEEQAKKLF